MISVNILSTGTNGSALAFMDEMNASGTVAAIGAENESICYEFYAPLNEPETIQLNDPERWRSSMSVTQLL